MLKALKIRIYPNVNQTKMLNKHFGHTRFVYNQCLELKNKTYTETGISLGTQNLNQYVIKLKNEEQTSWLKEINSKIIQQTLLNLETSFKNFFQHKSGFPTKKSKKNKQSFRVPVDGISNKFYSETHININKQLNNIKFRTSKRYKRLLSSYNPKSLTVSKTTSDEYYISILLDIPEIKKVRVSNNEVGIDFGIKTFLVCSDNTSFEQPKWIRNNTKKLRRLNKNLSRKVKGSNNKNKARLRLARVHRNLTNQRNHLFYNVSNKICSENQTIYLENLNVKGMIQNHKIAKSIQEKSFGMFKTILKNKAVEYNSEVVEIGRFYPSSKLCNVCGFKNKDLKLSDRQWKCPSCLTIHNRDVNASINILNEGKRIKTIGMSCPDLKSVELMSDIVGIRSNNAIDNEAGI